MNKKKIVIVAISDLIQEANLYRKTHTLAEAGFEVHLLAVYHAGLNRDLWQGIRLHLIRLKQKKMVLRLPEFVFKAFMRLFGLKADLYISYDLYPLLPLRIKTLFSSTPYIYDSVELFSEVEALIGKPLRRWFWTQYERFAIKKVAVAFTVCGSDARHLLQMYPFLREVPFVRNIPAYHEREKNNDLRRRFRIPPQIKIGLYQGQIFKGRGLENLISAVAQTKGMVLCLVGDGPLKVLLQRQVVKLEAQGKIFFIDAVPFEKLARFTFSADIGFTLISGKGLSYYHALPNKLFEYIQAGIPVIGSNYPEIEAIIRGENIGYTVDPHSVEDIAAAIGRIIIEKNYQRFKERALTIQKKYSWQKESEKYLQIIRLALKISE